MDTEIVKLGADDSALAQQLFELMACIFEEDAVWLGQDYVLELLSKDSFWAYAALLNGEIVGGLTAHVLPMTRARSRELMVYDLAVRQESARCSFRPKMLTSTRWPFTKPSGETPLRAPSSPSKPPQRRRSW